MYFPSQFNTENLTEQSKIDFEGYGLLCSSLLFLIFCFNAILSTLMMVVMMMIICEMKSLTERLDLFLSSTLRVR